MFVIVVVYVYSVGVLHGHTSTTLAAAAAPAIPLIHREDQTSPPPHVHTTTATFTPASGWIKRDVISATRFVVMKTVKEEYGHDGGYQHEKMWLQRLQGSGITGDLVSFDDDTQTLVMEIAGEPVRKPTLPPDWPTQLIRIASVLRRYNVSHNDIKPSELLVSGGRLQLVDFGRATRIGEPFPTSWRGYRARWFGERRPHRGRHHTERGARPPARPRPYP
jgi:hypothetical protein